MRSKPTIKENDMTNIVPLAKDAIIIYAGITAVVGLAQLGKETASYVATKIKK